MLRSLLKKYKKDSGKDNLHNLSLEFASALGNDVQWQWDDKFNAVLLHIDAKQKEKVVGILERYFSDYWNILVEEELPPAIETVMLSFSGMRPEQLLFSSDTNEQEFLYCAWWPWQDGNTTSLRIASYMNELPEDIKQQRIAQIKQWFGITP